MNGQKVQEQNSEAMERYLTSSEFFANNCSINKVTKLSV